MVVTLVMVTGRMKDVQLRPDCALTREAAKSKKRTIGDVVMAMIDVGQGF